MAKRVIAMFFALMLSLGLLFVRILSISQSEYAQGRRAEQYAHDHSRLCAWHIL